MEICGQAFCHGLLMVEWTWITAMARSSLTTLAWRRPRQPSYGHGQSRL